MEWWVSNNAKISTGFVEKCCSKKSVLEVVTGVEALIPRQFQELMLKDAIIMWGGFEKGKRPNAPYLTQENRGGEQLQI